MNCLIIQFVWLLVRELYYWETKVQDGMLMNLLENVL